MAKGPLTLPEIDEGIARLSDRIREVMEAPEDHSPHYLSNSLAALRQLTKLGEELRAKARNQKDREDRERETYRIADRKLGKVS